MKNISVLVPVYNVENLIEKCLVSLFSNSIVNDCEFIFVDDCSTDNSLNVLKLFCDKKEFRELNIKILQNSENRGSAYTRNVLLDNATGNFVSFIDSDDWVEKDYFEKMYNLAISDNCDVIGCWRTDDYLQKSVKEPDSFSISGRSNLHLLLCGKVYKGLPCRLIKREIIENNKIRFPAGNNMGEDMFFSTQLYYFAQKTNIVPEYLYHYIHYNTNSLCTTNDENLWKQRYNNVIETISYLSKMNYTNSEDILCFKAYFVLAAIISDSKKIRKKYGNYYKEARKYMYKVSSTKFANIYIWCFLHNLFLPCFLLRFSKKILKKITL